MSRPADDTPEDPRRRLLSKALALGWLTAAGGWNTAALAQMLGRRPAPLPAGKSIFDIRGSVSINGQPASMESRIAPGDVLRTGADGQLIAVVGQEALLIRPKSELHMGVAGKLGAAGKELFRLVDGALLAVFGHRDEPITVSTPHVYLGIRGTGAYLEARPEESYVCTCYGRILLTSVADPGVSQEIVSRHHDAPRLIFAQPRMGQRIAPVPGTMMSGEGVMMMPAPFINHTDAELRLLEALVGREVPFGLMDDPYAGPRRDY